MYESNMNMEISEFPQGMRGIPQSCEWEATAGKRVYLPGEAGVIISGIDTGHAQVKPEFPRVTD